MKKIGIITYHFAENYGAILQCYALSEYLKSCGYQVFVIDCVTYKQQNNNSLYRKNNSIKSIVKNILLLPFYKSRKLRFERNEAFRNNYLRRTKTVRNQKELETLVSELDFDYLISGSDQVFNPNIHDFEPTFLYPFHTTAKKIGYAVSVGNATAKQLAEYEQWIKDFNKISVREEAAAIRLNQFVNNTPVVLDPVFLLDKTKWESLCNKKKGRYVLCYYINATYRDRYIEISQKIAKDKGCEMIIVDARISPAVFSNKVITNAGPKEFVELFMNAELICTDSFHGTSFSILFEKPFVCFEPQKKSLDTRKTNLCRNAGLEDYIYYLDESKNVCLNQINYECVKDNLSGYINFSKEFLNNSLL